MHIKISVWFFLSTLAVAGQRTLEYRNKNTRKKRKKRRVSKHCVERNDLLVGAAEEVDPQLCW